MHCDLCVQDGHVAVTIKYEVLYEKDSFEYGFNPGLKTCCGVHVDLCVFWSVV